jgi:Protein of unknown function (DUF2846)
MRTLGLLSAVTLLAMFASAQQPTTVAQASASTSDKATIYVYRYKQFTGSALAPSVYCDDVQLARMENGGYFAVKIEPGQHTFRSNDKQSGVALDVKAGQQYFIRVEIAAGFMKGHGRLLLVAPEQGRYEINSKLKPLDSDKVEDKARVSVEEVSMSAQPAN